jgi:hypothetical protein
MNSEIVLVTMDIVWFVGSVGFLVVNRRDREKFTNGWMALLCTPVGFLLLSLLLAAITIWLILGAIPDFIFMVLNKKENPSKNRGV